MRIVHLGLGGFARAHQAWYTAKAPDADAWGIAGFTGRSPDVAQRLEPQDGLFTLVTRGEADAAYEVVGSLSEVHAAGDHDAWLALLSRQEVAVVTITVTEAGYCRSAAGGLDLDREDVARDLAALQADSRAAVGTAPGRLVSGLLARRAAGGEGLTMVPCDNLPHNGAAVALVVRQLADEVDASLGAWIDAQVSFASTMVDRITPRTEPADVDLVAQVTGWRDEAPVVTEPYSEWVISGTFPGGRPSWEAAGALLVDDVEPFETRKLWLLNGAHSILALAGDLRGHRTVADAVADPECHAWVEQWWDEAQPHLSLSTSVIDDYRTALLGRFANPSIEHRLTQIATDSSQKVPVRFLPVLRAERAAGRMPLGAARAIGAWVAHLRGSGTPIADADAQRWIALAGGTDGVRRVLTALGEDLGNDDELAVAVDEASRELLR